MNKGYSMMLEAKIQNLRKDNLILKEQSSKYIELEEQLGCPLDVVVKALQNGVYYEDVANCMRYTVVDLHFNLDGDFVLSFDEPGISLFISKGSYGALFCLFLGIFSV